MSGQTRSVPRASVESAGVLLIKPDPARPGIAAAVLPAFPQHWFCKAGVGEGQPSRGRTGAQAARKSQRPNSFPLVRHAFSLGFANRPSRGNSGAPPGGRLGLVFE